MSKEDVYDTEIAPLMTRIIELCQKHDVPMLASFELDDDRTSCNRPELACTTALLPEGSSKRLVAATEIIRNGFVAWATRTR